MRYGERQKEVRKVRREGMTDRGVDLVENKHFITLTYADRFVDT